MSVTGTILFDILAIVGIGLVAAAVEFIAESINKKNKHEDENDKG